MSDEQQVLGLAEPVQPKKRARRRRRGSIEVLKSLAVRVRIRDVRLPDGRVVELSKTIVEFRTVEERMAEAERRVRPALERRALDLECGVASFDAGMSLADAVKSLRAKGLRWRGHDASMWLKLRTVWQMPIAGIDAAVATSLLERWERDGYSPAYRRSLFSLLRRVLGQAAVKGLLARAPVWPRGMLPSERESMRGMKAKLSKANKLAIFEAARRIDARRGGDLADRLAFQLDAGLRPVECAWARVEDLRADPDGWHIYPRRAKGSGLGAGEGVDRLRVTDALAERIMARVDAMPPRARALGVLFPTRGPRGTWRPRWVDGRASRQSRGWVTAAELAELREVSGVAAFTAYHLRHTRMHELYGAGASQAQLQAFGAWRSARMVSVYASATKDVHPAMLEPSAPVPGASPLRVVDSSCSGTATKPTLGPTAGGMTGESSEQVNRVGETVGGGGRGRAVGAEPLDAARWWAELGEVPRAMAVELGRAALREAAEWPSLEQAAAAYLRREGARSSDMFDVWTLAARAGGLGADGPRLGAFAEAVREAVATRAAREGAKAPVAAPKKPMILRAVGDARDCPRRGIRSAPGSAKKTPGKTGKK